MPAINECPKCNRLAMTEGDSRVAAMYAGVCVECWRAAHPGEALPMPSQEFFPPSAIAQSKLFKAQLDDIWKNCDVSKFPAWDKSRLL